ncbi:MAG: ThuA domain-containing protein [Candidatus Omnitrophota bacterium]|jgi:type 1 glutamine amidotransferase|nr:MAG: ThuA domain-containing protein [Candidatus Omnitrophota bacterium]
MKFKPSYTFLLSFFLLGVLTIPFGFAQNQISLLVLTKSTGYEHEVVRRDHGVLSFVETTMLEIGARNNITVVTTKDAGMINVPQLKMFDVVMFFTSGDLREPSADNGAPMGGNGLSALVEWVRSGGGFFGSHTATATFETLSDFQLLSGGVFDTHKNQEEAAINVVDSPLTLHFEKSFRLLDEYYIFKDLKKSEHYQPLLILDTKSMMQEEYNQRDPYPIAWTDQVGHGRVFNCALGHREEVWSDRQFQQFIVNGIQWAAGLESVDQNEMMKKIRTMTAEERRAFLMKLSPEERDRFRERARERFGQRNEP